MAQQDKSSGKRERIGTGTSTQYVRRNDDGTFKESEDPGRASRHDQKRDAENTATRSQGDRGDRDK
jgi:hypothetical protein